MVLLTVVASDSGKCVDFHVLTKTSNACTSWEKQKTVNQNYMNNLWKHIIV